MPWTSEDAQLPTPMMATRTDPTGCLPLPASNMSAVPPPNISAGAKRWRQCNTRVSARLATACSAAVEGGDAGPHLGLGAPEVLDEVDLDPGQPGGIHRADVGAGREGVHRVGPLAEAAAFAPHVGEDLVQGADGFRAALEQPHALA